ncbi:MAG TPA: branched-chain amino acid ABC transporter permease [Nitrososphaerales archaeon]|nr:branched-chain amino acid ABC transporter permease [Nitrososphaerales archaeon]
MAQIATNAILLGLVYGMVGLGLSLILGIMNVLNIAHGSMYILGGYLTYFVSAELHYTPVVGFAFAAIVTFLLGVVFELILVDRVANDPTRVMLLTFGIAIVIEQVTLLRWGGTAIPTPSLVGGFTRISGIFFQNEQLVAAVAGVVVALITALFLRYTNFGRAMRMVSQNSEAAKAVGVNYRWVFAVGLGIGSLYAGFAGSLLSPINFVYPDYQWYPLLFAFVVVVVGGLGSVTGSIIGGLLFGILETIGEVIFPSSADILVFLLVIVIILARPQGLFGARERV